tara:strand:- start:367 stop:894 length:528 start_codon:yes stop_codon:yes gene_type:complete
MAQLQQQLLLEAIRRNPEYMSGLVQGKLVRNAAGQTLKGVVNMADDANKITGIDKLLVPSIKALPKGTRGLALPAMRFAGRALPVLGAISAVGDVGDIVLGQDSLGNKAMDAAAMGVGGTIGGVLGLGNPLLIAGGASIGKAASDGLQFLIGGGKSAEERKIEEAIKLLQQRGLV